MSNGQPWKAGDAVPGTPYQVVSLIGAGGMGTVYEVTHRVLGRRFVLKALHGRLAGRDDLVQRMTNEWRTLGALNHKNIVSVTDAGYMSTGVPYYVMERLDGESLSALLKRQKMLSLEQAGRLVLGLLDGLVAAHGIGAIHRDIKPQNIFISGGEAKLLDFGVAKLNDTNNLVKTAAGLTIGTPRYMSPEQAAGGLVDARSDIYAVGLVFYEMLAGRDPFAHIRESSDLILAHISEEPARVSFFQPSLPDHVGDLLHRWLAKSPDARPPAARAAAKELKAVLAALPAPTTDPTAVTTGIGDAETLGPGPIPQAPGVAADPAQLAALRSAAAGGPDRVPAGGSGQAAPGSKGPPAPMATVPGSTARWGSREAAETKTAFTGALPDAPRPASLRPAQPWLGPQPPQSSENEGSRRWAWAAGVVAMVVAAGVTGVVLGSVPVEAEAPSGEPASREPASPEPASVERSSVPPEAGPPSAQRPGSSSPAPQKSSEEAGPSGPAALPPSPAEPRSASTLGPGAPLVSPVPTPATPLTAPSRKPSKSPATEKPAAPSAQLAKPVDVFSEKLPRAVDEPSELPNSGL